MRLARVFIILAPVALAGCGQGSAFDEAFRNSFRESAVSSCVSASRATPNAPQGVDWQRLCSCSVDRLMQGKSSAELRRLQGNSSEQMEAVRQCAAEMGIVPGGAGPTAGGSDGGGKPTP
jgi:hypothetical protein